MRILLLLLLAGGSAVFSFGQSNSVNWQNKLFEADAFAENKGQFDGALSGGIPNIRYAIRLESGFLFFCPDGLSWHYTRFRKEEEKAHSLFGKKEEESFEQEEINWKMKWAGANEQVEIVAEDIAPDEYIYEASGSKTIRARAYRKITYRNLYDGIDVEYSFHPNGGIKYTFIVHPGADASSIAMRYSGTGNISGSSAGDLTISTKAGLLRDHAPVSFYEDDKSTVASAFRIKGKEVRFETGAYDKTRTLIIDPWMVSPSLIYLNQAYDIRRDAAGNVFVCGGGSPYQLKKFSSTGAPLWSFTLLGISPCYGDFCLDPAGNAYVIHGTVSDILTKVDPLGNVVYNQISAWNMKRETFRIEYNPVNGKLVTAGVQLTSTIGIGLSPLILIETDPSTGLQTDSLFIPNYNFSEFRAMAMEADGHYYLMSIFCSTPADLFAANRLWSFQTGNVMQWNVQDNYITSELQSLYTPNDLSGYNGLAVGCWVYTYDGNMIQRWNKNTGTLLSVANIQQGSSSSQGGICVDTCGNVFVGGLNCVMQYDAELNFVATYPMSNRVYDLAVGSSPNELLVTGAGHVSSITVDMTCLGHDLSQHTTATSSPVCGCYGTAGLHKAAICDDPGPLTYQWVELSQSGDTMSNLCPGIYHVVITATNTGYQDTLTINIPAISNITNTAVTYTNPGCNGCSNGTVSAQVTATGPVSYLWLPINATTGTVNGLPAGTYTVIITDSLGCNDSLVVTLTDPPLPPDSVSVPNVFTPNGDGVNDLLHLQQNGIVFINWKVFDRWGREVFSAMDLDHDWNGFDKQNNRCADGTYYYVIEATDKHGLPHSISGFITLLR